MRVLVTGGTGYLGRAIVRALAKRGHVPIVFARSATSATRAGLPGRAIDGDVRDRGAVRDAARDVDAICHTAALVSVWRRNAREFDDVNVGGLEHVIDVARERGLSRLVYTSSFLARPPAGATAPFRANDYQRTKAEADLIARRAAENGLPIVTLYPGVLFGPGVLSEGNMVGRVLADHLAKRLPGVIGPHRIWSFAWVEDVANAHVTALERGKPGVGYDLGGENLPQIRPFELLRDRRQIALPRSIPPWVAEAAGLAQEGWARLTGRPPQLTRRTVDIFRHDWPLDSSPATAALDYRPTPLAEGLTVLLAELGAPSEDLPGPRT